MNCNKGIHTFVDSDIFMVQRVRIFVRPLFQYNIGVSKIRIK